MTGEHISIGFVIATHQEDREKHHSFVKNTAEKALFGRSACTGLPEDGAETS